MAQVMPPSGGAPQGAPPQGAAPQAGAGGPQQGQQPNPAEAAIKQIEAGFMQIGKLIQGNPQGLDPQDVKLFQGALQATDAFIQSVSGPSQPQQPKRPPPSQPMPANAAPNSQPTPNQG